MKENTANEKKIISTWRYVSRTVLIVLVLATMAGFVVAFPVLHLENEKIVKCVISFICAGLVIGIFSSSINYMRFVKPINVISEFAYNLYNANLTNDINIEEARSQKEICIQLSEAQQHLRETLNSVVVKIQEVAACAEGLNLSCSEISQASEGTSSSINDVTNKVSEQSQSIKEALNSANDMGRKINRLLEDFTGIYSATQEASRISELGSGQVIELKTKTQENRMAMETVNSAISGLDNKTKDIYSITDTIITIAEQTNLLALNAAIEAARAGEAGKGFSVVADEIRKLAEQSSNSVKGIMSIIKEIHDETDKTIDAISVISSTISSQNTSIEITSKSFDDVSKNIVLINKGSEGINKFIKELAEYKESFVLSLEKITESSQFTTACSEEISAFSEEQNSLLKEISSITSDLNVITGQVNSSLKKFVL